MQYDDFSKSREALGRTAFFPKRRKKFGFLGLFVVILAIAAAAGFFFAVFQEISQRQARLNQLIGEVRSGDDPLLDNQLIGQLASQAAGPDGASLESTTSAMTGAKSELRQLLEKTDRPHLGNIDSGLVIVEFGDFECPICKEAFSAIRTLTNKYPNDVNFIFRNYPIKNDNSTMLAQASLCANDQNKFWQLHDRLFMSQGSMSNLDDFKALALKAGLNWTALSTCISSEKYRNQVMGDMSDALDAGVKGTPTFFVNGTKLEGAVPLANWEEIIKKYKELNK